MKKEPFYSPFILISSLSYPIVTVSDINSKHERERENVACKNVAGTPTVAIATTFLLTPFAHMYMHTYVSHRQTDRQTDCKK